MDKFGCLVFSSIEGTGPEDGSRLAQVIGKADRINHAVPTEAELARALPRLIAAGLVDADTRGDRYWLTATGRELYERRMEHVGLFGWMDGPCQEG